MKVRVIAKPMLTHPSVVFKSPERIVPMMSLLFGEIMTKKELIKWFTEIILTQEEAEEAYEYAFKKNLIEEFT